jgi:hypothetical protein
MKFIKLQLQYEYIQQCSVIYTYNKFILKITVDYSYLGSY